MEWSIGHGSQQPFTHVLPLPIKCLNSKWQLESALTHTHIYTLPRRIKTTSIIIILHRAIRWAKMQFCMHIWLWMAQGTTALITIRFGNANKNRSSSETSIAKKIWYGHPNKRLLLWIVHKYTYYIHIHTWLTVQKPRFAANDIFLPFSLFFLSQT